MFLSKTLPDSSVDILKFRELNSYTEILHFNKTSDEEQIRTQTQVTSLREPVLMQEDFLELITKSRAWSSSSQIVSMF